MKADFHIHTNFSCDALNSPQEIVAAAISRGIDCICITDHQETRGVTEALRFAFSKPILIIPGIEIRSKEGDILGLNVKEKIPNGLWAKETIKEINRLGGMAVIAHPFAWPHNFKGDLKKLFRESSDFSLAIEVFNASIPDFFNKKALRFAKKLDLPFTAGSDAHGVDFIGKAFLEIPGDNLSPEEILEAIRKKNGKLRKEEVSFLEKIKWEAKRNIQKLKRGRLRV